MHSWPINSRCKHYKSEMIQFISSCRHNYKVISKFVIVNIISIYLPMLWSISIRVFRLFLDEISPLDSALKDFNICTAVASMRRTEALASLKFVQMLFLHWTHSIRISPIIKRINWFASVTILVWLRNWYESNFSNIF